MQMMKDFYVEKLDLSRINYDLIVLLPKLKQVANIKQHIPICLLNVFYKIFTKVLATRLMEAALDIIRNTHTTFTMGRYILEGVLISYS
jgi:hypothetical protein